MCRSLGGAQQKFAAAAATRRGARPRCSTHFFQSSKKVKSSGCRFSGTLPPRPGAADPRTGDDSQFFRYSGLVELMVLSNQSDFNCGRGAEPKSDAALVQGPPAGSTAAGSQSAAPIGSQQQGYTHLLQGLLRARATPAVTEENIVKRALLRRCYCADTFDSLCCDARSTRARQRATTTTTEHTRRAHRMRSSDARRRRVAERRRRWGCCKHSESSRPRPRPRYSQGTIPPRPVSMYDGGAGLPRGARASNGATKGAAIVLARAASSGGAPVAPWHRGEARFVGARTIS